MHVLPGLLKAGPEEQDQDPKTTDVGREGSRRGTREAIQRRAHQKNSTKAQRPMCPAECKQYFFFWSTEPDNFQWWVMFIEKVLQVKNKELKRLCSSRKVVCRSEAMYFE